MTFANPLLLLTLLVVPVAVVCYRLVQRRPVRHTVRFTNLDVLSEVARGRSWRRRLPPALLTVALASLCIAVARPETRTLESTDGATVVLVIDASLSMRATDVKPSRLAAAQDAVLHFLDRVPKQLRVGLVVFAGEAQVAAPPTTDRELVRESVDSIGAYSGFGGTAIGDAITLAVQLGRQAVERRWLSVAGSGTHPSARRGLVSILFLSDGRQNSGSVSPLAGARRAKDADMRVYTIALGTEYGHLPRGLEATERDVSSSALAPDPETLKRISDITGGEFFRARSADALRSAYAKLGSRFTGKPRKSEIAYAFLAGGAVLLLTAGILAAAWSPYRW